MKMKIGFSADGCDAPETNIPVSVQERTEPARKSLVQVYFPARNMNLAYYNDMFDLHVGDYVYVDGKLEGLRGRVTNVNYTFKIKIADYKRVIAVLDTHVSGELNLAGSHLVAFDRNTIPYEKVITWFKAPDHGESEYISGSDGSSFCLEDLAGMKITGAVAERGHDYYMKNKVAYLCVDGGIGRAIVEGSVPYELEFELVDGMIRNLTCSCFCSCPCKHEFAAMLQLRETLEIIEKNYETKYKAANYFAAIVKGTLINIAIDGKESGSIILT